MSFSPREFRDALASYATGVTIITARDINGDPIGMTASSFNSVSVDPPLILWSVTKTAFSAPSFKAAEHFAVHILAYDQTELSNRFAKAGADKYGQTPHRFDDKNVPILANVAARFDCKQWAVYDGGDHWIIIGEVRNFQGSKKDGLVFSGGSYAKTLPLKQPKVYDARSDQDTPLNAMLFYHLSRAYHQVADRFHAEVRASGLMLPEWRILASLAGDKISRSMKDLSSLTYIQTPALSDMINSMENEGLCKKSTEGPEVLISGTKAGAKKVEHLFALAAEIEGDIFPSDQEDDAEKLLNLLRHVIEETNT